VISLPKMKTVLNALHTAFHQSASRSYRWLEAVIWVVIVLSVGLFTVDIWLGADHPWAPYLAVADMVVLIFFGIEIGLRILSFRPAAVTFFKKSALGHIRNHIFGRLRFCLRPMTLIDILTVMALFPALRGLRAVRLLRLFRTVEVFRYASPFQGLARAFHDNKLLYTFAFSLLGTTTMLGGVCVYLIEKGHNDKITGLGDAIWWALVTLTTVGYGDITPMSPLGKVVGGFMMVAGMFTLALFAGIVGHTLLNTVLSIREEQIRMSGNINHLVICGYDPGARMLLDAVLQEFDLDQAKVMIFAPEKRNEEVPHDFTWIRGDPTKESELDKVRMSHASAVIIVGNRAVKPQQADAMTILTAFTIRSYLKRHGHENKRAHPLYIVAEVLDSENVVHAQAAGADEVIETTHLGFSMLAHAISTHGSATIMSQVVTTGAHSLYIGCIPDSIKSPISFGDLRRSIKGETGALLIGIREIKTGNDHLNPDDAREVSRDYHLIYLAESTVLPVPEIAEG
jgi:voltage-gated potassium channel